MCGAQIQTHHEFAERCLLVLHVFSFAPSTITGNKKFLLEWYKNMTNFTKYLFYQSLFPFRLTFREMKLIQFEFLNWNGIAHWHIIWKTNTPPNSSRIQKIGLTEGFARHPNRVRPLPTPHSRGAFIGSMIGSRENIARQSLNHHLWENISRSFY